MTLSPSSLRHALALAAAAAALLTACGGSGGGGDLNSPSPTAAPTVTPTAYTLQTYITDNLATEYSKVWVSILKIVAVDAAGTSVTLFDGASSPATVNLASLANVGQFLSSASLPAGLYSQIKVTLANSVQLVSLDGAATTAAKFSATGTEFVWTVRDLTLNPASSGQLVLDFNLARFDYNATTGIVTPVVEHKPSGDAFGQFISQRAEVHGTVTAVNVAGGSFTVNDTRLGGSLVVTLASDATLVNESTHATLTLAQLTVGARVEVRGTVKPGATTTDPATVTTSVVEVLPADTSTPAATPRLHGTGSITALSGKRVTVSLTDANFLPTTASVVVDTTDARFTHGQASDLAVGLKVSFTGTASGSGASSVINATVFDIGGAPSGEHRGEHPEDRFTGAGVAGTVATVTSATAFTVTVSTATSTVPTGTYTVNATGVVYEEGSAACLVAGAKVKIRGTVSGSTVTAREVEISSCSGQGHSEPGHH